jgi:predicted methyltransferase
MKSLFITTTALSALMLAACGQPSDDAAPADAPDAPEAAAEAPVEAPAEAPAEPAPAAEAEAEAPEMDLLDTVLADARRDGDRARDQFRNPAETLRFFEVEPNHTVVDALPGGGWYSRILVPYTEAEGRYMGINYSMEVFDQLFGDRLTDERRATLAAWEEGFMARDDFGGGVDGAFRFGGVPAEFEGQADRVLYIRALHNMARTGNLEVAVADAFALLKPGGIAGVVQHRAPADETDERADGNRAYLRQADVIAAFEAGGFELVETSEINANPNDTADYDIGVWALPPSNAGDSEGEDVPPLQSVGESDRMTLKFRKPE